jgi:hypothetical protein
LSEVEGEVISSLSTQIQRAGTLLQRGAVDQIEGYQSRFQTIEGLHERLFKNLIVSSFDVKAGFETAKKLFGTEQVNFAAVDGTDYARPLFDLIVFFGGSYAARGTITYNENGPPKVEYENHFLKGGRALSSCVPVFVNEVPEIDQSSFQPGGSNGVSAARPLTDEMIANNSTIPAWIMTFSEFYLAYRLAKESDPPRIILLDRSLSATFPSLIFDSSKRQLWMSNGALHGLQIDDIPLDVNDLAFGRYHIFVPQLGLPPARGDFLRYRILLELENNGSMAKDQLFQHLKTMQSDRQARVEKFLQKSVKDGYLEETNGTYQLTGRYRTTWPRIRKLVETIGHRMFEEKPKENPMKIEKNGSWHWLTTQDMAFLTLFTLNMLIEECLAKNILLIGLAKDTAARDLKNHVIPVLVTNGVWKSEISQTELSNLPNTDRMLLQSLSIFNHNQIHVPWSLVEYDASFLSIVPDYEHRPGYVSGAIRNKVNPERLFAKTYIQLSQASYDPQLRSNVLLLDRLAYPGFDDQPSSLKDFKHTYGGADEPIQPIVYKDSTVKNPMQELVMLTLSAMTSNSIPELFGHNKPLFIADKVAKWHNEEMRRVIDTTGKWLMNDPRLRRFVFYMSTFRERRSEIETNRRESY